MMSMTINKILFHTSSDFTCKDYRHLGRRPTALRVCRPRPNLHPGSVYASYKTPAISRFSRTNKPNALAAVANSVLSAVVVAIVVLAGTTMQSVVAADSNQVSRLGT